MLKLYLKLGLKARISLLLSLVLVIGLVIKAYNLYQTILPIPIDYWHISDEQNKTIVNHQVWQEILTSYLISSKEDKSRRFDYASVTTKDKKKLNSYLQAMQMIDPRQLNRNEQFAYWINLYNALTISIVLKHYPLNSIKNIGDGYTGPWNIELAVIANQPITLNKIEHGILRSLWQEPRVHYVINCASIGCPDLSATALTGSNIEQQLTTAAKRFINQEKAVSLNNNSLTLSSIYDWFDEDFGDNQQALIQHLITYAEPNLKEKLLTFEGDINFTYNWELNDVSAGL